MSTPNSTDAAAAGPGDPLAVVIDLVAGLEPSLDAAAVETVVRDVAGARTRQRRLADALTERPDLLQQGRSPAPRVVGDLLIALRKAGAVNTSAPRCTGCGKDLRSIHQRGQDWYCGVCGPRREPCAGCGKTLPVQSRDRHGQAHCIGCGPQDDGDPLDIITTVVRGIDPAIPAPIVATAVAAISPRARRRLAWALQDRPDLLTGAGAQAPVPTVLTLIDLLSGEGEQNIVRPPCPHCGRLIALVQMRYGLRLCRNCVAKSRAQPCARCGALSEPATRDEAGRPLCGWCLSKDPAGHEICLTCGRLRPVHLRTPSGPLCDTCRPQTIMTCGICGRTTPCVISTVTGQPWCDACKQRRARCAGCGQVNPIRGGTTAEPLCATCTQPDPAFWRPCPSCGDRAQLSSGPCARCSLKDRLQQLLSDATGKIRPELQILAENLAAYENPTTVVRWLDMNKSQSTLRDLGICQGG